MSTKKDSSMNCLNKVYSPTTNGKVAFSMSVYKYTYCLSAYVRLFADCNLCPHHVKINKSYTFRDERTTSTLHAEKGIIFIATCMSEQVYPFKEMVTSTCGAASVKNKWPCLQEAS